MKAHRHAAAERSAVENFGHVPRADACSEGDHAPRRLRQHTNEPAAIVACRDHPPANLPA